MSEKFSTQELHSPVESTAVSPHDSGYEHTTTQQQIVLYNGQLVDPNIYEAVLMQLDECMNYLPSGSIHPTSELCDADFWDPLTKKQKKAVRRCVMHLAVTRNVDLIPVSCNADGEQMYYVM